MQNPSRYSPADPDKVPKITETPAVDTSNKTDSPQQEIPDKKLGKPRSTRNFMPIIMIWLLCLLAMPIFAQFEGSVSFGAQYSDNVFQLSEYDFDRFDAQHPNLEYARTTDDLTLKTQVDLVYPLRYKWYRFEPSLTASLSQNISNTDKWRRDILARIAVKRYYWDFKLLYGYYPHSYVKDYVDTNGSGELENYSYSRNLYRADLNVKPLAKTTLRANFRYEEYFYNQHFTEYDGDAKTTGLGIRQNFPLFILDASYQYRIFDNWNKEPAHHNSSYESNIYTASIRLKEMPLDDSKKSPARWHPSLSYSFEERFYQTKDTWNGGRIDKIYSTTAGINFKINNNWNILLDYSHHLRNIESTNASIRRLKPYSENRIQAMAKYHF